MYEPDGSPRWIEHPGLGGRADIVALPLTRIELVQSFPYDPSQPGIDLDLSPAEAVSVVGFPFGRGVDPLWPIWATGFIASHPDLDFENLPVFLIDCRARPGQSGSPVIAFRPAGTTAIREGKFQHLSAPGIRFLGVYCGRMHSDSDLGMVWKASAVAELVAHAEHLLATR